MSHQHSENFPKTFTSLTSRPSIALRVCVAYYISLAVFVWLNESYHVSFSLLTDTGQINFWWAAVFGLYYVIPAAITLCFALVFRPFWISFRNMIFTFVVIHGIFSVGVFLLRQDFLKDQREHLYRVSVSDIEVAQFDIRTNHDAETNPQNISGQIKLDISGLEPGQYLVKVAWNNYADVEDVLASKQFEVNDIQKDLLTLNWDEDTPGENIEDLFEQALAVRIDYLVELDDRSRRLVQFSRWAPFRLHTSWNGDDSQIYEHYVTIIKHTAWKSVDEH